MHQNHRSKIVIHGEKKNPLPLWEREKSVRGTQMVKLLVRGILTPDLFCVGVRNPDAIG
jgi:hypothetical protein